ncbi:alpha/beta fold hydrolase [Streptomyces sp. NPDC086549]|uniref:alpha/beta fold hydrolase n=1 Tax=Streptomyces sp. NPDC086549 TaxID=3365752 RepID=UPI0037F2A0BE
MTWGAVRLGDGPQYEWRDVMLALAEHHTVIVPGLRGADRSSAPLDGYGKKSSAADVRALLRHLNLADDVRLVGHDIGSMVAYAYAAQFPSMVRRLVLSQAPVNGSGAPAVRRGPGCHAEPSPSTARNISSST